ncbi:lysylphosphatidylglycerol synthase domain-containing protein [Ornithinimicrobium sp. Y1847]|uniref:lysylphosphatidylglycerol synthase domain-containing protein n=1 Tax=unclassified Ornithinimicrobium TaxID=2615080 RepID=UPI003B67B6A9
MSTAPPSPVPASGGSTSRSWTERLVAVLRAPWVRRGFVIAAVAAAVLAVILEWDAVSLAVRQISWPQLLLALLLSALNVCLAALSWRAVSAGFGAPLGLRDAGVVYLVGQVGKYLPGGVWNLVASAELGSDRGIARRRTVGTMLVAVLISAAVGGLLVLLTLPGAPGTPLAEHRWLVWLLPLGLLFLVPAVLNRILVGLLRLTRQEPVTERIGWGAVLRAAWWSLLSWIAIGLQVFTLALAVGAMPGMPLLRLAIGGYALAWIVGFVLIFLPAGVGAREGMLALALISVLDRGGLLVVVLLSRVLLTVADLATAGLVLLAARTTARDR